MGKFELLTTYIQHLQEDEIGVWFVDHENDGTPKHPIQLPYVHYSEIVQSFINDFYIFDENNKDMELTRYQQILNENEIEWNTESMKAVDVSSKNSQCVTALIMGTIRAERFSDGVLLDFFKSGHILKWLERLKELDDSYTSSLIKLDH